MTNHTTDSTDRINQLLKQLEAEVQALRERSDRQREVLEQVRDVLKDAPGVDVGNSKVHFAYHKACSGLAD
ncbi:hypothetical protein WJ96_04345 [Burkholderia ubonensis]|uniref:DUF3618 domain-containing protein n=1 Tax=Burkholderia ubonensis TaxID=101571 RepID=A0AAW3MW34_9BURK|nr:hypothetical protein [Burkholderia ubonensis]KVP65602.1 hypothetical protein WJ93_24080 [Burkholderia ubonensis]KVP97805.1 hypothetical protein WJ96_04345 [Burkholderia ubonensis]KVZ92502.1 hypothetical protein WL25_16000 [Burkholderia ubonensis]